MCAAYVRYVCVCVCTYADVRAHTHRHCQTDTRTHTDTDMHTVSHYGNATDSIFFIMVSILDNVIHCMNSV